MTILSKEIKSHTYALYKIKKYINTKQQHLQLIKLILFMKIKISVNEVFLLTKYFTQKPLIY